MNIKRLYALNKIASDGKGLKEIPTEANINEALEDTYQWFSEELARKYVQNKIEGQKLKSILLKSRISILMR